ncbi:MAG: 2-oxoacid:acceptor oxidoreductase family protein [Candidatus Diapherotrites archaeon]
MRYNIIVGGEAGQGPNILTQVIGEALVKNGNHVFYSRDYQSLIRGGHNFNTLTFSEEPVCSNDSKIDILVCLDKKTEEIHKKNLKQGGIILRGEEDNMYYAGRIFKLFCLDFKLLEERLRDIGKRYEENLAGAKKGYEEEKKKICKISKQIEDHKFLNGNQGISEGALKSGIEIYYAYPMTPATSVMNELAEKQEKNNLLVLELENEIAIINAGIGSSITGKKVMIGTSGGGFDLMTEGLSLTGIAEVPLVIYLSQRPGPGTGVATYTSQGDLNDARHSGHGEFSRVVFAPGDPEQAEELTNRAFYFSQKYKIPSIIIGDKHLAESFYTIHEEPKFIEVKKSTEFGRYNSYEKDSIGSATENPEIVKKNVERRIAKAKEIKLEAEKYESYRIYGNENSKNVVLSWGSTKGAIVDAIKELNCKFLQILHIEPFCEKIKKEIEGKKLILVENNSTGQLGGLIAEKTGIFIEDKNKILKYDGNPFFADELKEEIRNRLR